MLEFFYADTPNGLKVKLFLEETGLPHTRRKLALGKGEQFEPAFLAISPNNKIPALVDHAPPDGGAPFPVFESGAILLYLARKTGLFLPPATRAQDEVLQWLFWQMGGLGPMAGQCGHFRAHAPESVPYAIERYTRELARLYRVLDLRLAGRDFIVGDYSIADMACYPWVVPHASLGQSLETLPHLARWFERIAARPATQRSYESVRDPYATDHKPLSEAERAVLFGAKPQKG